VLCGSGSLALEQRNDRAESQKRGEASHSEFHDTANPFVQDFCWATWMSQIPRAGVLA